MSKKSVKKPEATSEYPKLQDFIASKLKQPSQKNTAEQLKVFWNDFKFQLGKSGIKLRDALKSQFYNIQQPVNWARDREDFLEDLRDINLGSEQLENLKIGYLYAVYNITRETLKTELTEKLRKYQQHKKEAQEQIDAATKPVSPKKKSKTKSEEQNPPVDVEKLKIKIAGYDTVMDVVMRQLKEYKDRMVSIKASMDNSRANSKQSSPKGSPLSSPKLSPSSPQRSATVSSVSASPRRLTIGTRRPVSASVEEESPRNTNPESPKSQSQPASPRNTVNASPRLTSASRFGADSSQRRLTIGSRKPSSTKNTSGSLGISSDVISLPPIDRSVTEVLTQPYTDLTLGSPKPSKKLPTLPVVHGAESLKRDTVTLTRESSWGQPIVYAEDANLARGSLPVIKDPNPVPVPPLRTGVNSSSVGRGQGSVGRGKLVRPPAPTTSPAKAVVKQNKVDSTLDDKSSVDSGRDVIGYGSIGRGKSGSRPPIPSTSPAKAVVEQPKVETALDDKSSVDTGRDVIGYGSVGRGKAAILLASSTTTADSKNVSTVPSPRKASVGRGMPLKKPAVPQPVSEARRKNSKPIVFSRVASQHQEDDQNRPVLSEVFPVHRPVQVLPSVEDSTIAAANKQDSDNKSTQSSSTIPNLRIGTNRPKPAPRIIGKAKPGRKSLETLQSDDEDEIIIQSRDTNQSQPVTEMVDQDLDFSSNSEEEKPQVDHAKKVNAETKDQSYDEDDTASVSEHSKLKTKVAEDKESNSLSDEHAKETPRTAALKQLPEDKASRVLKAIIYPGDFTRVVATQQYRVKDYKAVETVIKKFKGLDSAKIEESYLFTEENAGLRKLVGELFDHLVLLQDEQLKWETPPAKYHFKNNGEAKIEGLVELFNTIADPNKDAKEAKKQIQNILASKEDKGLLKNRGTGAYFIGSFFRREKNPVNGQYIRSTTERKLVEIYNALDALQPEEKNSVDEHEVEQSEFENNV